MENFFKCPKSQYICIFTSPINTILTTQFILSRQSDSRDSVVIGTVWVWDRAKGSETLKIPVYTLIPRHPDLQLLKQALLIKQ